MALLKQNMRWAAICATAYSATILLCAGWICFETGHAGPALGTAAAFIFWALVVALAIKKKMQGTRSADSVQRSETDRKSFLAKMSHEIRTPLNGILGMTEIARATRLDDNQQRIIGVIENETNHLLEMVNHVLDFSKIDAGKLTLESVSFNLRRLMEGVGEIIAVQAGRKGLEANLFQSPQIPRRLVGDPVRLRQVLLNLAGNSVKFTWEGEINIRVELISRRSERATIRFTVQDTGIGIAADDHAAVFESFTQVDSATTRTYGGTGLGAAISKSLVSLMGGTLCLDSDIGRGTTVWFELPFGVPSQTEAADQELPPFQALNVLVADDCFTSRQFALKYLDVLGCRAEAAADGIDALRQLKTAAENKTPFDLIITDFRMPGMSGYELARQVRTMTNYRQVPIIAVTALQEIASGEDFRNLGFDHCLAKPLSFDDLRSAMTDLLAPSAQAAPTPENQVGHEGGPCRRILLAEDYPTNQQVAMMHLTSAGYSVDLAENGQRAVELFSQNRYDLVLMDLEMPIMDGYAAARAIRKIEQQPGVANSHESERPTPIVAVTAHALKGYEQRSLEEGMDAYLTKPLRRNALLAAIDALLMENARNRRQTTTLPPEANSSESAMDWDLALEEFLYQEDVLGKVMADFLGQLHAQVTTIDQALCSGDTQAARKQAHAIKGGAANLCAMALSRAAEAVEKSCGSGSLETADAAVSHLKTQVRRMENFWRLRSENGACLKKDDGADADGLTANTAL